MKFSFVLFSIFMLSACGAQQEQGAAKTQSQHDTSAAQQQKAAVAMPDAFSADVAKQIMQKGGNAVDAAIAAQFVLAVTLPEAGNIGGGGFMLVYKDKESDFIDYREQAPLAAHRDMYLDAQGNVVPYQSVIGILSSGVPGTVAGMWLAHEKYGTLPWKDLVDPAVKLAKDGFVMPEKLAGYIGRYSKRLKDKGFEVNFDDYFASAKTGEVFKQAELGATLALIRDQGRDGFYKGKTAKIIADFMANHKGLITEQDLAEYEAKARQPISAKWREYDVLTSPPPSSGGIAIIQWLTMYDQLTKGKDKLEHNSAPYIHLLAEAGKRVFADRAEYLGDPDFVQVPVSELIDPNYIAKRGADISMDSISVTELIKPGLKESEETTHFSIVDKWGNAVSNTTTINLGFGSGVVVEGAGFLLNDEMDDFSAKPGVANVFGAVGGEANEIHPKKRMLSSMTPTIVLKDGEVSVVTGSPGGTTIISSVYTSILNALEFNMSAQDTVDAPRFHHQLLPKDVIRHHDGIAPEVITSLEDMGYTMEARRFGDLHTIINRGGELQAGSESHGRGKSMVFE
ncbi:gamma-glutamyltransferase 1, Threonine peptidase, MEROPS family T03 [Paraglaciecola sp. T6c]|uniref:gamma-glutamyltransferase n=1 Tax=Pseudoalteromonas atlantica (strain T6c / ATCC BAA-1087) TaxID=3042615 RepID=UPI00005C620A|nr:gamma-glutamyltransferase [Paraglaciecola sp. T6c]ABG40405.1 gamma-glutamyltransferase 1, Threonine peptidase, MEROPS family T03 [Paraglaciecola sp. T6c]